MVNKEILLELFNKEFATTLKVMNAYPEDKLELKPHDRSQTAGRIMSTFVFEMFLIESYVFGEKIDRTVFKNYSPPDLLALITDFEKHSAIVKSKLEAMKENDLGNIVEFAGTKLSADKFMLLMLFDQIHHRGQMTVYTRLAGGKVPSVYGPTADDSSTNIS